jgi:hypothetical protein
MSTLLFLNIVLLLLIVGRQVIVCFTLLLDKCYGMSPTSTTTATTVTTVALVSTTATSASVASSIISMSGVPLINYPLVILVTHTESVPFIGSKTTGRVRDINSICPTATSTAQNNTNSSVAFTLVKPLLGLFIFL